MANGKLTVKTPECNFDTSLETVFVTGGAGYIGSHAILELLECGYDVVAADNFSNSKPEAIERLKRLSSRDFVCYEMDVRCADKLNEVFSKYKIDCVMHFAGLKAVGESVKEPLMYYANNLQSTIAISAAMCRHNVKKIIFSSSASVYSESNPMPLTESSEAGNCLNPYAWTKYMCEQILRDTALANDGWSVVNLRYFNVIGAHESGDIGEDPQGIPNNLMPFIAQTAVGRLDFLSIYGDDYDTPDGTGVRDYIHVTDLVKGHVAAIEYANKHDGTAVFNLGTGKGSSVFEMVKAFEDASGVVINKKIAPRRPGDLPVCYASVEKARKELGWTAAKTICDAARDTWRWQSKNPNGYGA